jgi:hypothetical protein
VKPLEAVAEDGSSEGHLSIDYHDVFEDEAAQSKQLWTLELPSCCLVWTTSSPF